MTTLNIRFAPRHSTVAEAYRGRLARQVREHGDLSQLPAAAAKEIEYLADLASRYLWIVGPGSVHPPQHVFEVTVVENMATFGAIEGLPDPPQ